jgi:hypothetical protein
MEKKKELEIEILDSTDFLKKVNETLDLSVISDVMIGSDRCFVIGASGDDSFLLTMGMKSYFTSLPKVPYLLTLDCALEFGNVRYEGLISGLVYQDELTNIFKKIDQYFDK